MRLPLILTLALALAAPAGAAPAARPAPLQALALTLEGPVEWRHGGAWRPAELGQVFGEGDELRCGEQASLLLSLDDERSLALDAGAVLALGGPGGGLALAQGAAALLGPPVGGGAGGLALRTPNARVQALGGEVELWVEAGDTQVQVPDGAALLGDLGGLRTERVGAGQRRHLTLGRLLPAETVAKRERFEADGRWGRARQFHGQRAALLQALRASPDHSRYLKAWKARQPHRRG